jgi:hypothetical protein
MKKLCILSVLITGLTYSAVAQQKMNMSDTTKHHKMPMKHQKHSQMKNMDMQDTSMKGMDMGEIKMDMMSSAQSKNLPMNRDGSGTSWLPDASPMYGIMLNSGKWSYMLHGDIAFRYTKQDLFNKGSRGNERVDAPNWFMGMAQRPVGKNGLLHFNLMMSLDRLTEGGNGYPLLFQTGESWKGIPLVDRQHPHDLFSELSASSGACSLYAPPIGHVRPRRTDQSPLVRCHTYYFWRGHYWFPV